jgi:pimeloyl-ACP methyl ester carboxylesterase
MDKGIIAGTLAACLAAVLLASAPSHAATQTGVQTMPADAKIDWALLHKRYPGSDAKDLPLSEDYRRIEYPSDADDSNQGAQFYRPAEASGPVPLLVILHPWSSDRDSYHRQCVQWCIDKGWAAIAPDFRGANHRPAACGSQLVVKDITSAVRWARGQAAIDGNRIYLIGTSGGGMAALLLAGRTPETWAGVSAWAGISDLAAWHREQTAPGGPPGSYAGAIEKCCGGPPGASKEVDEEYRRRSPITWLRRAKGLALDINAGIRDGHDGSVPVSHSLLAYNALADEADRVSEDDIRHMTQKAEIPPTLRSAIDDPSYGRKKPLFRKTSGKARVTIFDGGHELVAVAALTWLEQQRK